MFSKFFLNALVFASQSPAFRRSSKLRSGSRAPGEAGQPGAKLAKRFAKGSAQMVRGW